MKILDKLALGLALASLLVFPGCDHEGHDHDNDAAHAGHDDHGDEGPNGGHIVELGSVGHLEFVHDEDTGKVTIHLTGPDLKKPLAADEPPALKLLTDAGQATLVMTETSGTGLSQFSITDSSLATEELRGRISIKIGGAAFNPDLEEAHGH